MFSSQVLMFSSQVQQRDAFSESAQEGGLTLIRSILFAAAEDR